MAKKTYGILLIILFATLVFSMLYPFYPGIREGLGSSITATDISNIQQTLNKYYNDVESAGGPCDQALTEIKAIPAPSTSDAVFNNVMTTVNSTSDQTTSKCALVDKAAAFNTNNPGVSEAINACYGKKYTSVLNMLNTLKKSDAMKDSDFANQVNSNIKTPIVSGTNSSYNAIQTLITMAGK